MGGTFTGGCGGYVVGGWVAGSSGNKAISASNLKLKLKLTEAELGNRGWVINGNHSETTLLNNHRDYNNTIIQSSYLLTKKL